MLPGKEKMFIIDEGRVEIMNINKIGFKTCFQKVLRTIKVKRSEEVAIENVYGYSSIVCDKTIQLHAVCKDTSICYTLGKEDFYSILSES